MPPLKMPFTTDPISARQAEPLRGRLIDQVRDMQYRQSEGMAYGAQPNLPGSSLFEEDLGGEPSELIPPGLIDHLRSGSSSPFGSSGMEQPPVESAYDRYPLAPRGFTPEEMARGRARLETGSQVGRTFRSPNFDPPPPDGMPASAGLSPELAAAADRMDQNSKLRGVEGARLDEISRNRNMRPGYIPPNIGMPSPRRGEEMAIERMNALPPDAGLSDQLRNALKGLESYTETDGPRKGQITMIDTKLKDHPAFNQLGEANRLNRMLPPGQRQEIPGIHHEYSTINNSRTNAGSKGQDPGWAMRQRQLDERSQDPRYIAMMNDRAEAAGKSQTRRDRKADYIQANRNGSPTGMVAAKHMIDDMNARRNQGGGPGGDGGGDGNIAVPEMMALGAAFGDNVIPAAMEHNARNNGARMQAEAAKANLDAQNAELARQTRADTDKAIAAIPGTDLQSDLQKIGVAGGFHALNPELQRQMVQRRLGEFRNSLESPQLKEALGKMGIDVPRAITILGGDHMIPDYRPTVNDRIGGLFGGGRSAAEKKWRTPASRGLSDSDRDAMPAPGSSAIPRQL